MPVADVDVARRLVDGFGEESHERRSTRSVAERFAHRLAHLAGVQNIELGSLGCEKVRTVVQHSFPERRWRLIPATVLERTPGRQDGSIDVHVATSRNGQQATAT